ncbi:hypothetical protein NLI96_g164 [Meripilus lineatus]|uniref:NADP-dependent oxidoreductase domain-containing protein n=1 Tax=Meripilus lineatus TaxID=2056292 RepID=A0AAD5YP79_9APHY|nr:hypothetical protein NLI96_g164 [Physisporinus lineatus]
MSLYAPAPEPATKLGYHRQLSPLAGVHVSPICLGAMSIGDKWHEIGLGAMDKEQSFKLLDAFYDAGGNFIDTANGYQDETSEEFIGEWMEKRGIRDQLVIATKCLVTSGKVLYLGISDTPAWVVAKANTYARLTGKAPFVVYQGSWSILSRDFERDIIPMARSEGLALAPWNVLGGGKIRTDAEEQRRRRPTMDGWERNADEKKVCQALEKVAAEIGAKSITAVAIAYVMQKVPYVFPIIGGRKVEHFHSNLEALEIALSPEQISFLEGVLPFNPGFPANMIVSKFIEVPSSTLSLTSIFLMQGDGQTYMPFQLSAGHFVKWPAAQAIRPSLSSQ